MSFVVTRDDWIALVQRVDAIEAAQDALAVIDFSALTTTDSDSNTMIKAHAYLAATDGFVHVKGVSTTDSQTIKGYVGADNNPESNGNQVQGVSSNIGGAFELSMSFSVAEGEYFEITSTVGGALSIFWRSAITLSAPADQD